MVDRSCFWFLIRRPIFIPPVIILLNLCLIILYGAPLFDQEPGSKFNFNIRRHRTSHHILQVAVLRNKERLINISKVCERYNQNKEFRELKMSGTALATADDKLFYCSVPKVGCTYWKRILRYITKDFNGHIKSPEEIPRMYTHFGPYNNTRVVSLHNTSTIKLLDNKINPLSLTMDTAQSSSGHSEKKSVKFMFTRDPYERLWSGYLDKLYLPDFWSWLGIKIINTTRPLANKTSLQCGNDVNFEEFLQFTTKNLKVGEHVDSHFSPIYSLCNPCLINFDVIGKLETFLEDSTVVLKMAEVSLKTNSGITKQDITIEEVKNIITYNFDLISRLKDQTELRDCYNPLELAKRLWTTFQYHGYISDNTQFPVKDFKHVTDFSMMKTSLIKRIVHLRKLGRSETESWTKQRQKYIQQAYTSVSQEIFDAIGQTFKGDFELFGYNRWSR